ncbi:MAG: nickel pincer cofactor biosynthesis protein LarB [Bacillota bacterium]|nr:nickel pincer cofactor biosynthesis protein LarB [Bacillota bacterium]
MEERRLRELLEDLKSEQITTEEVMEQLKELPFKDLGFANIDNHRKLRTGFPEVVFGQGKTSEQIRDIMKELAAQGGNIMTTRASQEDYSKVREDIPEAKYFPEARIILVEDKEPGDAFRSPEKKVAVVTAGTADIPVAEEAAVTAEILGNRVDRIYDVGVAGIHRLFAKLDRIREADVVIVVAGMEGALASVVGGLVETPVIAVPTSIGYGANLGGVSALLSMLNSCANGVGVVNIDNGFGAAYLASVINRR